MNKGEYVRRVRMCVQNLERCRGIMSQLDVEDLQLAEADVQQLQERLAAVTDNMMANQLKKYNEERPRRRNVA